MLDRNSSSKPGPIPLLETDINKNPKLLNRLDDEFNLLSSDNQTIMGSIEKKQLLNEYDHKYNQQLTERVQTICNTLVKRESDLTCGGIAEDYKY